MSPMDVPLCIYHVACPTCAVPVQGVVKCVEPDSLTLTDNTVMPFGLCIWSTGVGPTPFTLSLPFAKTKVGRIAVGEWTQ
jgi:NADH dehydrogenase FAD-containing subunit